MKRLFALAISIALFTGPLLAQDFSPYSRMTLEELLTIDTGALDKAAKKDYKKALKAAKAAAKAHAKAEKKRRKAEAKANKKHNKAIDKVLERIDRTYEKSSIYQDDFEAYTRVSGPLDTNNLNLFGVSDYLIEQRFWLEAFYDPYATSLPVRLYISDQVKVQDLNENTIGGIKGPVENYLARKGYWNNFVRATLRGGTIRQLQPSKRYLDTCTMFECYFREEFYIELDLNDTLPGLTEYKGLDIKVANANGEHYIFSLPYPYILGYLKRFGDLGAEGAGLRDAVVKIENTIRSSKKQIPAD